MAVRNESWAVGASARIALKWLDRLVILNHASIDDTQDIIEDVSSEHPGRVVIITENDPTWREMAHRQRMLQKAREMKATHVAICDADEVLTGNLLAGIRDQIAQLPPGGSMCIGMPCMWRSLDQYRTGSGIWANRFDLTLAFADTPSLSWAAANGYDHHQREPKGSRIALRGYRVDGGVMHLQWASWRRLVAKHALYKIMERLKYPQKAVQVIDHMYSLALDESGLELKDAPAHWWAPYADLRKHFNLKSQPWQEIEARRLWKHHGAAAFAGLNLFGVVGDSVAA